jgi:citrate lyase subunit beta/citryl-CoA lyase
MPPTQPSGVWSRRAIVARPARGRRSVLYVPASNARALEKAAALACDAVIFDLEDAVAPEAKAAARDNLVAHFSRLTGAGPERVIRVNVSGGNVDAADVAAVARCRPDAMLVPKVDSAEMLRHARAVLDGQEGGGIALWAMIETPGGIVRLRDITEEGAAAGLDCLVAGTNDLSKATGVPLPEGRDTIAHWLAAIVIHARAAGMDALDGVYNDFGDDAGLAEECRRAALSGFDGKTLIHPRQIETANAAFSPSPEAVAQARAVVAAFEKPENAGKGVISLDGRMVELLHLEIARRTLARLG